MATNELARRIRLDVSTTGSGSWVQILGITDLSFPMTPTKVDTSAYDTAGWKDFVVPIQEWSGSIKVNRYSTSGVLDAGQTLLTNCVGQSDPTNQIYCRWYDKSGKTEPSWQGLAIVEQSQSKTGVADVDEDGFAFTGRGAPTAIANPFAAAAVPVITAAGPSAVAVGGIVQITGVNFTGTVATTGVKFLAVNATSWIVASDQTIVAVMPAGSAGSAPITVTNAAGASVTFPYTRGA